MRGMSIWPSVCRWAMSKPAFEKKRCVVSSCVSRTMEEKCRLRARSAMSSAVTTRRAVKSSPSEQANSKGRVQRIRRYRSRKPDFAQGDRLHSRGTTLRKIAFAAPIQPMRAHVRVVLSTVVFLPAVVAAAQTKPVVVFLATGGTIAMKIDPVKHAPVPAISGEDLLATVPDVSKYARV